MRRRVAESSSICAQERDLAIAQMWLEGFVAESLALAGMADEMALVCAMGDIAAAYVPEKTKPNLPEDHLE